MIRGTLAGAYLTGVKAKEWLYRKHWLEMVDLPARVVSVGNLSVGGAGKTPLVEWLARAALRAKQSPAILSRGYGRRVRDPIIVPAGVLPKSVEEVGDEPYLLKQRLPEAALVVHADRGRIAGEHWPELRSNLAILDDGFQHWRVRRDCDVLVCDLTSDLFPGALPLGNARESLRALARADLIVFTRASEVPKREAAEKIRAMDRFLDDLGGAGDLPWKRRAGERKQPIPFFLTSYEAKEICYADGLRNSAQSLGGKSVLAVSGIARPRSFLATLEKLGANLVGELRFGDHHWLSDRDSERIFSLAARFPQALVLCTEKDFHRWRKQTERLAERFACLRVDIAFGAIAELGGRLGDAESLWQAAFGDSRGRK